MKSITAHAYGKINLTLDVFNRRSDGYHSLASIVQAISLHDTLHMERTFHSGVRLSVGGEQAAGIPTDASNIVVKAARAVLDVAHCEEGLDIHLHKRIPSQAGLGGGSSDAAAALYGITTMFGFDIGPNLLHDIAADLGSDVPFFLCGGTAVVRGRGENISPVADAPPFWLVVVKPPESVSTALAYRWLDDAESRVSNRNTKHMEEAIRQGDIARTIAGQCNDFELPVFAHLPALAWLRDELRMAGAVGAHLCGSGSALYGIAESQAAAQRMSDLLLPKYPDTYVARTISRIESNPLRERPS